MIEKETRKTLVVNNYLHSKLKQRAAKNRNSLQVELNGILERELVLRGDQK